MKKTLSLLMALCMLLGCALTFSACGEKESPAYMVDADLDGDGKSDVGTEPVTVVISVLHFGEITVELLPEYAPITVCNFLDLVDSKFYDGLTFHRISKGFMIQGGDPNGNGSGGSDRKIKGEYSANGVYNPLSHTRGTISMARRGDDMNSASSQFFICDADSDFLDGKYAAFGKVTKGMDVVDKIADVAVTYSADGEMSSPINTITIESIRRVGDIDKGASDGSQAQG
ncbi:MAG: peptidylprolyl isomerase [Ruminococcaceae bacterium]|nr:peptidylprolyl isomerase [Oscillospiraceae bacterium]